MPYRFPRAKKGTLLTLSLVCLSLTGCLSLPGPQDRDRPEGKPALTLTIKGKVHWVCEYDGQKTGWKFDQISGVLSTPRGTLWGTQENQYQLLSNTKQNLRLRVEKQLTPLQGRNLPDARFQVTSDTLPYKTLIRSRAQGGLPWGGCPPSQRGKRLSVPFSATYSFWK